MKDPSASMIPVINQGFNLLFLSLVPLISFSEVRSTFLIELVEYDLLTITLVL